MVLIKISITNQALTVNFLSSLILDIITFCGIVDAVSTLKGNEMSIPVWKTVEVGNLSTSSQALDTLREAGVIFNNDLYRRVSCHTRCSSIRRSLDLVLLSPCELGIKGQITADEFLQKHYSGSSEFTLCPAEAVFALLLQEPNLVVPSRCHSAFGLVRYLHIPMFPIEDMLGRDPMWLAVSSRRLGLAYCSHFSDNDDAPLIMVRR